MSDIAPPRRVLRLTGKDRISFLQGLVSNDLKRLESGIVFAALLTPQGKYLSDFFLVPDGDALLLDVAVPLADDLLRRLTMYRLRADVAITPTEIVVTRGLGSLPAGAFADPRDATLGWRHYGGADSQPDVDWDAIRVAAVIPEAMVELIPNETFILEAGFERLSGVDFRKGCYVGQEVTARMKHKTELRKGLARVSVSTPQPLGTAITVAGKAVGTLFTQSGGYAIAHLRFDRADGPMRAGDAVVTLFSQDAVAP